MTTAKALCLNMIVKNEMANLQRCLGSAADHIDCWVIGDTGSTDGTQDFIRRFFAARNIPGELHSFPFHNFAQARNAALDFAYASPLAYDYLLLDDADMELVVEDRDFRNKLTASSYSLLQRSGISYWNTRLVQRSAGARYHGVTHEYVETPDGGEQLHGVWYKDHASGSNRVDKFERDIRLLEEGLKSEPNNHRYWFYLAQSYRDARQHAKAAKIYAKRAAMGGWDEEAWYARMQEARCLRDLGDEGGFLRQALAAFEQRPQRAEPLYDLARYFRDRGKNAASVLFSEPALGVQRPEQDTLFLEDFVYTAGLKEEYAIAANYARDPARKDRGFAVCNWLALNRHIPEGPRNLALSNLHFYIESAAKMMPSFVARPVGFAAPDGYRPTNPSIARQGDEFVLIQRAVNYTIDYTIPDGDDRRYATPAGAPITTRNFLLRLDGDLAIRSSTEIPPPEGMPEPAWSLVKGFEDLRPFVWRGGLWCIGCVRELTPEGWCEQVLARIDEHGPGLSRLADWRVLQPEGPRDHQKNWMPCVVGDDLQFVYRCDPTRLVDDQARTIAETIPPIAVDQFRGGSQLIAFDGGWLALVHEARVLVNGERHYRHHFVWFDEAIRLRGVSRPFFFQTRGVEFAAGLAWHPDRKRLIVTYGVADSEAWIATVNADDVRRVLENAEQPSLSEPSRAQRQVAQVLPVRGGAIHPMPSEITIGEQRQKYSFSVSCVENREHMLHKAAEAVEQTIRCVRTDYVYWFSSKPYPRKLIGTEVINILIKEKFENFSDDTNKIYLELMPRVITTDYNIAVQPDGFAINPDAWDDDFLNYDYVGAPWPWMWGGGPPWRGPIVGNGGFSLRSRRLYEALRTIDIKYKLDEWALDDRLNMREYYGNGPSGEKLLPEDILISLWYRDELEQKFGVKFCPPELASKFSVETVCPFTQKWLGRSFGFHGIVAAPHYGVDLNSSQKPQIPS